MVVDLLKLHLFLFYSSVSCNLAFIVVYYKTYTDALYNEIGTLMMLNALLGALCKTIVCSIADRHHNYKQCLMTALSIMFLFNLPLVLLPFYPQLLFAEPHPRFVWYFLVAINLISYSSMGVIITLNDVFIMHKCTNSTTGQYWGQFRVFGVLGWSCSSLLLAGLEPYVAFLPALVLPMSINAIMGLVDLVLVYHLPNIERKEGRQMMIATLSDEYLNMGKQVQAIAKPSPSILELNYLNQNAMKTREKSTSQNSIRSPINLENFTGGGGSIKSADKSGDEISFREQLDLLLRLNRYDHYHLLKYLVFQIILGTITVIHYCFYLEFMVEILKARGLFMIFFSFNAVLQLSQNTGESLGLLFISRLVQSLGRDVTLMFCFIISGIRYAIVGFLDDYLNVWLLALIDIQTGILFGVGYSLCTETAASYSSLLDRLLLTDTDSTTEREDEFLSHLEQLKDVHSIETIRFALKATIMGLFSGANEGVGFALGPLIAGFWLNFRGDSIELLYQDLVGAHLVVLSTFVALEFVIIRLMLGNSSRVDKLRLG